MSSEFLSSYRVFPRVFSVFYLYGMHEVSQWFMLLPEPSNAQSAFAASVVTVAAAWFKFYVDGGKNGR